MRFTAGLVLACLLGSVALAAEEAADTSRGAIVAVPESVTLFNGKDLTGWRPYLEDPNADPAKTWSVKDGVLRCEGKPAGYIRTETPYGNYRLRFEWRWPAGAGNSGLLLHINGDDKVWPKCIESQLHAGDAGDLLVSEGTDFAERVNKKDARVAKMKESNEKPLGEWNTMDVTVARDTITVHVNGLLQNRATKVSETRGCIGLQSEGAPIEFRNIMLQPLKK